MLRQLVARSPSAAHSVVGRVLSVFTKSQRHRLLQHVTCNTPPCPLFRGTLGASVHLLNDAHVNIVV